MTDPSFGRDIERSLVLKTYIDHWGMPQTRRLAGNDVDAIELYRFPASAQTGWVDRLATVGVSEPIAAGDACSGRELMFAWLPDSSNHPLRSIQDVALDVAAYLRDKRIREDGFVIQALRNPVPLAATMMLIDEPLTEKDTLKTIALNGEIVNIAWVVPVFPNEAEWIRLHGMASFDQLREQSSQNLFRLDRRSMIDTVA